MEKAHGMDYAKEVLRWKNEGKTVALIKGGHLIVTFWSWRPL